MGPASSASRRQKTVLSHAPNIQSVPQEILNKILGELLIHPTGIRCLAYGWGPASPQHNREADYNSSATGGSICTHNSRDAPIEAQKPLSIMLVCRSWYHTAFSIYYSKNHFHFDSLQHLNDTLGQPKKKLRHRKTTVFDPRRNIRPLLTGLTLVWGNKVPVQTPEPLNDCDSLTHIRMWIPHDRYWNQSAYDEDPREWAAFTVLKNKARLKEITLICPNEQPLGLQTSPSKALCSTCEQLQLYLNDTYLSYTSESLPRRRGSMRSDGSNTGISSSYRTNHLQRIHE